MQKLENDLMLQMFTAFSGMHLLMFVIPLDIYLLVFS